MALLESIGQIAFSTSGRDPLPLLQCEEVVLLQLAPHPPWHNRQPDRDGSGKLVARDGDPILPHNRLEQESRLPLPRATDLLQAEAPLGQQL